MGGQRYKGNTAITQPLPHTPPMSQTTLETGANDIHVHAVSMLFPLIGYAVELDKTSTRVDESDGTAYGYIRHTLVPHADNISVEELRECVDVFKAKRVSDAHLSTDVLSFKRHDACTDSRGTNVNPHVTLSWCAKFETPQTAASTPVCSVPVTIWSRFKSYLFGGYTAIDSGSHTRDVLTFGGKRMTPDDDEEEEGTEPCLKRHNSTSSPTCPSSPLKFT